LGCCWVVGIGLWARSNKLWTVRLREGIRCVIPRAIKQPSDDCSTPILLLLLLLVVLLLLLSVLLLVEYLGHDED
jgi:hypothetical protein